MAAQGIIYIVIIIAAASIGYAIHLNAGKLTRVAFAQNGSLIILVIRKLRDIASILGGCCNFLTIRNLGRPAPAQYRAG